MLELLLGCVVFLALMAALFVPLEGFFPAHAAKPTTRAMALGAGLLVLNTFLMQLLGWPVLAMLNAAVGREAKASLGVVAFVFLASDLVGYAMHRAMHGVKFLWRFHALHHEAHELSWLDAWRQHPVDFVLHGIAVGIPGALLGASLSEVMSVVLLRKAFTTFLHANVKVSFGPLRWVLASPEFHRVHHSADARDHDRNFAGTFPIWDVVFRTAKLDARADQHGERSPA